MDAADRDLIDTLWNVKEHAFRYGIGSLDDLIDTLWNVKMQLMQQMFSGDPDLIDTLWNVKADMRLFLLASIFGFNRYIVECKEFIKS